MMFIGDGFEFQPEKQLLELFWRFNKWLFLEHQQLVHLPYAWCYLAPKE